MTPAKSSRFLKLFFDPSPAVRVKFRTSDETEEAKTIDVKHRIGAPAGKSSAEYLDSLGKYPSIMDFCEFYRKRDGADLCRAHDSRVRREMALVKLAPAEKVAGFTSRYLLGGDRAWTIDLNKSKSLYRNSSLWIAFGQIGSGPECLMMFLDGDHAGCVYYLSRQPEFNILKPIAPGFQPLLDRIASDLPAFLRLLRASVVMQGGDGANYGFSPVAYLGNGR